MRESSAMSGAIASLSRLDLKAVIAVAVLASASPRGAESAVPPELSAARAKYAAALEAAQTPVRARYASDLQAIKARALAARNLELAVAVDEELKTVSAGGAVQQTLRERLIDTTWVWWQSETVTFLRNGKLRWSIDENEVWTWQVTDQSKRIVEGRNVRGVTYRFVFDEDLKAGTLVQDKGKPRPTQRLSPP